MTCLSEPFCIRIRLLVGIVLLLGGCAPGTYPSFGGSGYDSSLSPDQRYLRQQTDRFSRTVAEGAAIGALAGAIGGYLYGRDAKSAALGGVAGAAVGAGAGYYVASQNRQYASLEQGLNARIAAAQQENAYYRDTAAVIERVVAANEQKIAELNARYRSGLIDRAGLQRELASAVEDRKRIGKTLEAIQASRTRVTNDLQAYRNQGVAANALVLEQNNMTDTEQRIVAQYDALVRALEPTIL